MPKALWKEPAPLWNETKKSKPHLLELKTDDFIPAFLKGVQEEEDYLNDKRAEGAKLYQPLHQRYYLVTASLVCRMAGFPDKSVAPQNGEKTAFVVRRKISGTEFVWIEEPVTRQKSKSAEPEVVKERGWHLLTPESTKHEERFPVHGVTITSQGVQRKIYFGYIPVGNRKKYVQPPHVPETYKDQVQAPDADDVIADYNKQLEPKEFGMSVFRSRIVASLTSLIEAPSEADRSEEASFYFLVDLSNFIKTWLRTVWDAINSSDPDSLNEDGDAKNLYEELDLITIKKNTQEDFGLLEALREINDQYNIESIAEGKESIPGDESGALPFDLTAFSTTRAGSDDDTSRSDYIRGGFSDKMSKALEHSNHQPQSPIDPHRLLEAVGPDEEPKFELTMIYEYDPDCPAVYSDPSRQVTFAAPLDNEAPARPVTIEMPDIGLAGMRKSKHGVQIKMPKKLRDVVSRLNKGILKGEGLSGKKEIGVDAVCIFSIPIITLCAFIVMMIFMIALNFIFWWLPFLKICLPLPKKGGSS